MPTRGQDRGCPPSREDEGVSRRKALPRREETSSSEH